MHRTILKVGWISLALATLCPALAHAQWIPTDWEERVILIVGTKTQPSYGQDPLAPEPLQDTESNLGCTLDGKLSYGPPGAPSMLGHTQGQQVTSNAHVTPVTATAAGSVTFQVRVTQKATPPVPVNVVPITIYAHGSVRNEGSPPTGCSGYFCQHFVKANGSVSLVINSDTQQFLNHSIVAGYLGANLSFNEAVIHDIPPNVMLQGEMNVSSMVDMQNADIGMLAICNTAVSFQFVLADAHIPGTQVWFSDYFKIEYSPGYWALDATPVQPTTWGRIKTLYSNP